MSTKYTYNSKKRTSVIANVLGFPGKRGGGGSDPSPGGKTPDVVVSNDKKQLEKLLPLEPLTQEITLVRNAVASFSVKGKTSSEISEALQYVKKLNKTLSVLTDRVAELRSQLVQELRVVTRKELNEPEA